jgi:hypothetical protein
MKQFFSFPKNRNIAQAYDSLRHFDYYHLMTDFYDLLLICVNKAIKRKEKYYKKKNHILLLFDSGSDH